MDFAALHKMEKSENLIPGTTVGEELSPLRFDRTEYTDFSQFIAGLSEAPDKPIRVSNKALSVNGKVVRDGMEKYLTAPGESSSALKEVLKTPRHYLIYKEQKLKRKDTSHFELGTFAHSAFLEPSKFDKVIVEPKHPENENQGLINLIYFYQELLGVEPDCLLSELKNKALREKLKELRDACDYTIIDEEDQDIIDVVRAGYKSYGGGILPHIFKYAQTETSMYGTDPQTGLKVKIRPDAILLEENIGINAILSLKTTSANSIEKFYRDCASFRYELSEGMYLDVASDITGRDFTATVMVVLQTVIPFQIAVFYWDAEDLQIGKYKFYQAMDIVKDCREKKSFPGFDAMAEDGAFGIIQMKLPAYIKNELKPTYIESND